MKREEMLKKMVKCYETCMDMRYPVEKALDRVLEMQEESGMAPPPDFSTTGLGGIGHACQWEYDGSDHE